MPKINIDELVEPIEVTVGGKTYILADIPRETARRMAKLGGEADKIQDAISDMDDRIKSAKDARSTEEVAKLRKQMAELVEKANNVDNTEKLADIMTEVLGAEKADITKLGMRKILMLVTRVMQVVNDEVEGKNVPKVAVTR